MMRSFFQRQWTWVGLAAALTVSAGLLTYLQAGPVLTFTASGAALAFLAKLVGDGTEHLGTRLSAGATGILQSAIGNLPELFVGIFALRAGLLTVVQSALIGSILANSLLVLGLAYKPNVDDDRESPSYVLMEMLTQRGAKVDYYDPYVPVIRPTREHPHWAGTRSVAWNRETIGHYDLVLIATHHATVNYAELAQWAPLIVDTRNAMAQIKTIPGQVWKA